jgi:hypothetical protein
MSTPPVRLDPMTPADQERRTSAEAGRVSQKLGLY